MRRAAPLALMLVCAAGPAAAEALITSLSSPQVSITSNYTGSSIVLFGAIERDGQTVARAAAYDVVVTARGPRQALVVREKEPVGPVWLNREQQKFPDAPAYLGVFSSRPLPEITGAAMRARLRIGIDAIVNAPDFTLDRGGRDEPFRDALVRLKRRERLFVDDDHGVSFLAAGIFRATVPLPATAPPGPYRIDVALFADGVVLARSEARFELVKIGFEQHVGEWARDKSASYGAATAAIALLFGWVATVIFRRD